MQLRPSVRDRKSAFSGPARVGLLLLIVGGALASCTCAVADFDAGTVADASSDEDGGPATDASTTTDRAAADALAGIDRIEADGASDHAVGSDGAAGADSAAGTDSAASDAQGRSDACLPQSCIELARNCGFVDDGCGSSIFCGACAPPNLCGGSGTPNVCGQHVFAGDLAGRFQENELMRLTGVNQLAAYFADNHVTGMVANPTSLPACISLYATGEVALFDRCGIVIPLGSALFGGFYKIEATLVDSGQTNLQAYLTLIDRLWSAGANNGVSVGIDTTQSPNTYWYTHTRFIAPAIVDQAKIDFSRARQSRFVRRQQREVPIAIYVTPVGVYATVNGANFASLPTLYTGDYVFQVQPSYLVLGKWNSGGDQVLFKEIRIKALDDQVDSIDEANAHFLKTTVDSGAFAEMVAGQLGNNGGAGFQSALWAAFLYRAHDYYFRTNHVAEVRQLVDVYLSYLPAHVDAGVARYGVESTLAINHSFINGIQPDPYVALGVSSYLREDQRQALQREFAKVVDVSMAYIAADGSFPVATSYVGDTFAEEITWLISFYAGYYASFPGDTPRSAKILDYLAFLGFHHMSDGRSIRQVYGDSVTFTWLPDPYRDFVSRYVWDDGAIDNHDFHPSLNYAQGIVGSAAIARNILLKRNISVPTLSYNLERCFERNIRQNLDPATARLSHANPKSDGMVHEDWYEIGRDGSVTDFYGATEPSRVEDWGNTYVNYHILENYGDATLAEQLARTVYYKYHSGTGRLFCGHEDVGSGQRCSLGTQNFYNYMFGDALYALLFSLRSSFDPTLRP